MATLPSVNPGGGSHARRPPAEKVWSRSRAVLPPLLRIGPRGGSVNISPVPIMHSSFQALYIPETFAGRPCIYLRIEIYREQSEPSPSSRPRSLSPAPLYPTDRDSGFVWTSVERSARSRVPVLEIAWIFRRQLDETKIDGERSIFPSSDAGFAWIIPAGGRPFPRVISIIISLARNAFLGIFFWGNSLKTGQRLGKTGRRTGGITGTDFFGRGLLLASFAGFVRLSGLFGW